VALGDSYTIGTGLDNESQNFPSLLARKLREETGIEVDLVNLGLNGYTTADLIREELPVAWGLRPELVTILIGANDLVQGSDESTYRTRLSAIYDTLCSMGLPARRVLALSIPDFSGLRGAAPFGSPRELRSRIDALMAWPRQSRLLAVSATWTSPRSVVKPVIPTVGWPPTDCIRVRPSIGRSPINSGPSSIR
jgi:lysophospholipase L1-like esterase